MHSNNAIRLQTNHPPPPFVTAHAHKKKLLERSMSAACDPMATYRRFSFPNVPCSFTPNGRSLHRPAGGSVA